MLSVPVLKYLFPVKIIFFCSIVYSMLGCSAENTSNEMAVGNGNSDSTEEPKETTETLKEKETHHPFLIVTKDMFPSLREKSKAEPWKSIKEDALLRANESVNSNHYGALQKYVGAAALSYILDESNSQEYAHKVRDVILNRFSSLEIA